jgi:hypothetical protein
METKTNLNNVQRKMLDEVYTAHFQTLAQNILQERNTEYKKLCEKVKEIETKKHKVKLDAYLKVCKSMCDLDESLRKEGLRVFRYSSSKPEQIEIEVNEAYKYPLLAKHKDETRKIEEELSRKKKEIRARIYGMDMTYEQVEKEIAKEIASIKK